VPSAGSTVTVVGHHPVGIVPTRVSVGGVAVVSTSNTATPFADASVAYTRAFVASYASAVGSSPTPSNETVATAFPAGRSMIVSSSDSAVATSM
jgi:hypothetical protein